MMTALLQKHWIELRGRWFSMTAFGLAPGLLMATGWKLGGNATTHDAAFVALFGVLALAIFPSRSAGTGVSASIGARPQRGGDPAVLFTLSLPIRRRDLFLWRTACGVLAMESAALVALAVDGAIMSHAGTPWAAVAPALWVLPALVPLYLLDCLLLTWFSELTTMQVQAFSFFVGWFLLQRFGAMGTVMVAVRHVTLLPALLLICVLSLVFGVGTGWRLNRQSY